MILPLALNISWCIQGMVCHLFSIFLHHTDFQLAILSLATFARNNCLNMSSANIFLMGFPKGVDGIFKIGSILETELFFGNCWWVSWLAYVESWSDSSIEQHEWQKRVKDSTCKQLSTPSEAEFGLGFLSPVLSPCVNVWYLLTFCQKY